MSVSFTSISGNEPPGMLLDVSRLPSEALDYRSPLWWGNALLLCIETSMFMILVASYLYFRRNFEMWPPPKVDQFPPNYHPLPLLPLATVNLIILLLSLIPMAICARACTKMNERTVQITASLGVVVAVAAIVLRFREFWSLQFRWDDNAYGSITWAILGVHLMHLVILCVEDLLMSIWVWVKGLDDKHARDIRITAIYWYWVVGIWVILYALVYWYPRVIG
jgi:heme/copper-type cytochrome/quinol oxidase subunit 3